jgi:hypothetical protein
VTAVVRTKTEGGLSRWDLEMTACGLKVGSRRTCCLGLRCIQPPPLAGKDGSRPRAMAHDTACSMLGNWTWPFMDSLMSDAKSTVNND